VSKDAVYVLARSPPIVLLVEEWREVLNAIRTAKTKAAVLRVKKWEARYSLLKKMES